MALDPNMKLIEAKTVGAGGIASIEFTSIPQTYTDLKILVSAKDNGSGDNAIRYNLVRGATQIHESYLNGYTSTSMRLIGSYSLQYLDSPNTTSSTTYKTQFKNFVNSGTIYTQVGSATATMILMEIGA